MKIKTTTKHHFVVVGDVDENGVVTFVIDHDTADIAFPDGSIYDYATYEWLHLRNDTDEQVDITTQDVMLSNLLKNTLRKVSK